MSTSAPRRPWETPHAPGDTIIRLGLDAPGVRAGISRSPVDASDRVAARWWAARAAGTASGRVALLHQVHGARVVAAPWEGFPAAVDGDALVTSEEGLALCVRVADCVPVALAVKAGGEIAMVHAGWRGVARGVVAAAVRALCEAAGRAPCDLRAVLGPAIGPCCYEVGPEFAGRFDSRLLHPGEGDRLKFDLPGAVRAALLEAGLLPDGVAGPAGCTACSRGLPPGAELHSHRGSGGAPARNIAFVVRSEPA